MHEAGMMDTLEYYTMFHIALKYEGAMHMLSCVLMAVIAMLWVSRYENLYLMMHVIRNNHS